MDPEVIRTGATSPSGSEALAWDGKCVPSETLAREQILESPELLRAIIETTPECIKIVARDGRLVHMNPAGLKMVEAGNPSDVEGQSTSDLIAPEYRDMWQAHHERVCNGESLSWEFDIISLHGTRRHMQTNGAPLRMPDGSIAQLAITRDITERKIESKKLECAERQFRELLEALPAAIYTTDAVGRITFYNPAAVELAGRVPAVGDEWCVTWRLYMPDGTPLPHDQCPMAVALRENRAVRGVEAIAERPDGTRVPFIPFPTPIRDASGKLIGAVNMLVDISERQQAETQQHVLLNELNHRVKNNMQMLCALLRTAQRESRSAHARAVLGEASQRVVAMVAAQQVLYNSKRATKFDSWEFLDAVCSNAKQAFDKSVNIETVASKGELSNDAAMPLALILNELLTNAVKYGIDGREHGLIKVGLTHDENSWVLFVEDDGPGFDFEEARKRSSGLGLVIGLARQLGGRLTVERSPGARCTVRFASHS
jgi:PAS domain S-box-containing protein